MDGCGACPKRPTCKAICNAIKKYLAHKFRAHNSPNAILFTDLGRDVTISEWDNYRDRAC